MQVHICQEHVVDEKGRPGIAKIANGTLQVLGDHDVGGNVASVAAEPWRFDLDRFVKVEHAFGRDAEILGALVDSVEDALGQVVEQLLSLLKRILGSGRALALFDQEVGCPDQCDGNEGDDDFGDVH